MEKTTHTNQIHGDLKLEKLEVGKKSAFEIMCPKKYKNNNKRLDVAIKLLYVIFFCFVLFFLFCKNHFH